MIAKKDNATKQSKSNYSINIQTEGRGRNLLMIHGSPGSVKQLVDFQKLFASSFTVTIFDRPGHGLSSKRNGVTGFFDEVTLLGGHFFEDSKEPIVLCGHSYGAILAMALAATHQKSVSHLVLISPPPFDILRLKHVNRFHLLLAWLIHFPLFGFFFTRIIGPIIARHISEELVRTFFNEDYIKVPTTSFLEFKNCLVDPQLLSRVILETLHLYKALPTVREMAIRIQCPTLIVLGEKDDRAYFENAKDLQATLTKSFVSSIKGSKHYPHVEQSKGTFLEVSDFLEKTGGSIV